MPPKVQWHKPVPQRTQDMMDELRSLAVKRDKALAAYTRSLDDIEEALIGCRADPLSPSYAMMAVALGLTRQRVIQLVTRTRNRINGKYLGGAGA